MSRSSETSKSRRARLGHQLINTYDRKAIRAILWVEQGGMCIYCGCAMVVPRTAPPLPRNAATIDHIIPVDMGGTREDQNLALACLACNSAKSSMHPADFLEQLAASTAG